MSILNIAPSGATVDRRRGEFPDVAETLRLPDPFRDEGYEGVVVAEVSAQNQTDFRMFCFRFSRRISGMSSRR